MQENEIVDELVGKKIIKARLSYDKKNIVCDLDSGRWIYLDSRELDKG